MGGARMGVSSLIFSYSVHSDFHEDTLRTPVCLAKGHSGSAQTQMPGIEERGDSWCSKRAERPRAASDNPKFPLPPSRETVRTETYAGPRPGARGAPCPVPAEK